MPYKPQHDKTNKMTCARIEVSDQPEHAPCLIESSLCAQREANYPQGFFKRTSKTLIRLGAHVNLLALSCCGSVVRIKGERRLSTDETLSPVSLCYGDRKLHVIKETY